MKIEVTEQDILSGERRDSSRCAVALAVKRATGCRYICVSKSYIETYETCPAGPSGSGSVRTPIAVRLFIDSFDMDTPGLEPFSFDLPIATPEPIPEPEPTPVLEEELVLA